MWRACPRRAAASVHPPVCYLWCVNIYVELTHEFNEGALRAILSSGPAAVLHRIAVMSKDGDWILDEEETAIAYVRRNLDRRGAQYRFGAPLDPRWLAWGWSAHFEFRHGEIRVRTDFVSRPPRLDAADLDRLWLEQESRPLPFLDARRLAEIKKTNREKDYAVIGELARLLPEPREQMLLSRSARDLERLAGEHPELLAELRTERPALGALGEGLATLEAALDAERRQLMHANERRLERYLEAAQPWAALWPSVAREIRGMGLDEAHRRVVERALGVLPFELPEMES